MGERIITEAEASLIFNHRFNAEFTPRSEAYKTGCKERLARLVRRVKSGNPCPYEAGTAEFDAYYAGFDDIVVNVDCFIYRRGNDGK